MGWAPGSLSDDGWAGSGALAMRELSVEISLLLARPGPQSGKLMPGDLALSCQTREQWIGGDSQEHCLPDHDLTPE